MKSENLQAVVKICLVYSPVCCMRSKMFSFNNLTELGKVLIFVTGNFQIVFCFLSYILQEKVFAKIKQGG